MKKTILTGVVFLIVCFLSSAGFCGDVSEKKDVKKGINELESRIIRIEKHDGVRPQLLTIEAGTVVIWLNRYQGQITIQFPEKKVAGSCEHPVNFSINKEGKYVSDSVEYGAVASLCFVERGTFEYFITRSKPRRDMERPEEHSPLRFDGKIIVK
jgi:hypothetical protein